MRKLLLFCLFILSGCTQAQTTSPEIEEQQAKQIALKHANIEEKDLKSLDIEKHTQGGTNVYTIQFSTDKKTYDYLMKSVNGEIIKSSFKTISTTTNTVDNTTEKVNDSNTSSNKDQANNATNTQESTTTTQTSPSTSSSSITKEEAKTIALSHAQVNIADTRMFRILSDTEDGIPVYSVEFYAGNKEYDYDIAKSDGRIISYDYDIEGYTPSTNSSNTSNTQTSTTPTISMEKAKSLVLAKVTGANEQYLQIELDNDDGKLIYEGELHHNNMEYEFEMDATTGNFLEWSVEHK